MSAPQLILDLVQRFQLLEKRGKLKDYNELSTRNEFIDRFFEALGWDVRNEQGENVVVLEESKRAAKQTLRPDYAFKLAAKTKFFVEAKRPSVALANDQDAAFQLRRYGWSAGLNLNILTNFAHLAVYDCRIEPNSNDPPTIARYRFYSYQQYAEKWDEIVALFGQEAVLNGSLAQFELKHKPKRVHVPMEKAFLAQINLWRDQLAHNFFAINPALTQEDLNFAVQMTINRLLFLRICEDHAIEPYRNLQQLLPTSDSPPENDYNIYPQLCTLFQEADLRYNAGLFHFNPHKGRATAPDILTLNLRLANKTLIPIIEGLDPELCPYAFQVIPVEILGQIYEQFLGKVITMTANGVEIVDKPEVRKAGGVYYTPQYIVDYIVSQTLGVFLANKTPKDVANLTILDPACGSGSFLLGAYRYLLNWYEQWYQQNEATKWRDADALVLREGKWRLTLKKRGEILRDHIFGVDKDPQAVEVAKFSLFLKYLEEENEATVQTTTQRLLPDMDENIKCGNSLISTDFKSTDMAELQQINPFNWQTEFPQIMVAGGFDVVIGNPPYVRQGTLGKAKDYFQAKYLVFHWSADLYTYFIERGVNLLKPDGIFGYIVANKWFRANYAEALRCWLKEQNLQALIDFGDLPVFQGATTYPCILLLRKAAPQLAVSLPKQLAVSLPKPPTFFFAQVKTLAFSSLEDYVVQERCVLQQTTLNNKGWTFIPDQSQLLLRKLQKTGILLSEYTQKSIRMGILTGLNEAFVIDEKMYQRIVEEDTKSSEIIKPFLIGRDIKSYHFPHVKKYLILMPRGWTRANSVETDNSWEWLQRTYPAIASHLAPFAEAAKKRCDKGDYWWELRPCDYYAEFEKPKLIYPSICKRPEFTFDSNRLYANQKCFIIPRDDKYLLGILNSSIMAFLFSIILPKLRGGFYEPSYIYLKDFPIKTINFADQREKAQHDQLVELVEKMLELHKKLVEVKIPQQKALLERQISATDQAIDALVYELYGLTEEEIGLVEGARSAE